MGIFGSRDGGLHSLIRFIRRRWFRVLLKLGYLIPILDDRTPVGASIPKRGRAKFVAGVKPASDVSLDDPILERLQQIAVLDLCDLIGLRTIPGTLWRLLRRYPDPDEAVVQFIWNVGCDVEAVLRREPKAVASLNEVAEVLQDFDTLADDLTNDQRRELQALLWSGEQENFLNIAAAAVALARILRRDSSLGSVPKFRSYLRFINEVRRLAASPKSVSPDEARVADETFGEFLPLLSRFHRTSAIFVDVRDKISSSFPDSWRGTAEEDELHRCQTAHEDRYDRLSNDPALSLEEIAEIIRELEIVSDAVADLWHRAQTANGGTDSDSDPSTAGSDPLKTEYEKAFAFFEFSVGTKPSPSEVKKRYRDLAHKYHPDKARHTNLAELREKYEKFVPSSTAVPFSKDTIELVATELMKLVGIYYHVLCHPAP